MRGGLVVLFSAAIAAPGTAHAGRTFYGWLHSTEVMPERGVELFSFVSEENQLSHERDSSETRWWVGPSIGINDQLELVLPVQLAWSVADGAAPKFTFDSYGAELRYRFVTQDPVDKPDFAPLVRVAVNRVVGGTRDIVRPEADFVGTIDNGPVQVVVDLGAVAQLSQNQQTFEIHPGAGISVLAAFDLRFGAELYSEVPLEDSDKTWVIAGPNLAWSHGRTWLSAAYGIGLYHIHDAPRLNWGIAF